ncbi:MAG: type II secretion system F family protein [Candidatus Eisenbacteria bacterium]|nr:type II secretion system F family protein [Candidatus Eisenbacteria bacterium]
MAIEIAQNVNAPEKGGGKGTAERAQRLPATPAGGPAAAKGERGGAAQFFDRLNQIHLMEPKNVGLQELVLFTQQLALLIETGNGLVPSVEALSRQVASPPLRKVLGNVHDRLEEGSDLSSCLQKHPKVFDSLYISLVRAGEASGALQESLVRVGGILEVRRQLRNRLREAMTYPMVLSTIMVGTVIFLLTYMVPKFSEIFDALGNDLPRATSMLLGFADLIRSSWWLLLPIAGVTALAGYRLWKTERVQRVWDRLKIGTPFLGDLTTQTYMYQMFSSLGLLLSCRVPHLEAIGIARQVVRNAYYREFFGKLEQQVRAGRGMAQAFQEAPFLPETVKLMVSTGEASGALDIVMAKLAERYKEDLESNIRRLSIMLEPVMLVVMGLMVGFVAMAFILPIMRMSRAVH